MKTVGSLTLLILISFIFGCSGTEGNQVWFTTQKGTMDISVTASGELRAVNDIKVNAPFELRSIGIYNGKIQDIVPEGSRVKAGDVIATLDKTELMNKLTEASIELQKAESEFLNARLDTTLTLREARDVLKNHLYSIEEKKLLFEQSAYEVPSIQKQAKLDLQKAKDTYQQTLKNYETKKSQANAKMAIAGSDLASARSKMQKLQSVVDKMNVRAPEDGMVIYYREWNGRKRTSGSSFNVWNPTVASLPDLRYMESICYVNEVDVQKVKVGQSVEVKVDAMVGKTLNGEVKSVANIGEQRNNSSAKVFEVLVKINSEDTTLRPSMSTQNRIKTRQLTDVISVPLEAVHASDSITFVYLSNGSGLVKQEIETGLSSETHIEVVKGIDSGDRIAINVPNEPGSIRLKKIDE